MLKPEERAEETVTFVDNGFSGGNTDRDGFREMMQQIMQGSIQKVLVYRLDRISRSLSDFVSILDTLKKHGVQFVSSQESFDTSTPYGEMIVKILMVFAEFERQSIIERVTQAYAHRSDLGIYMGGRRPYGFTLIRTEIHGIQTKMLAPVESEIRQIRYIFDTYAAEGISLRHLADSLMQNTMEPADGGWSAGKLSAIIRNPIYVRADNSIYEYYAGRGCRIVSEISAFDGVHGVQLYGKTKHIAEDMSDMKIVILSHEGIIPAEQWLACQKKIARNKQIGKTVSNTTSWLGGKVYCKKCGRVMRAAKGSLHTDGSYTRYFGCTGKSHKRICDGVKVPVYAESLETMVYGRIAQKLSALKADRPVSRNSSARENRMKNRISEIQSAQEKLVDCMIGNPVEPDMLQLLNERAQKLAAEQQILQEKLEAMESAETEGIYASSLAESWKSASFAEKKAAASLLIDRINIREDGTTELVWNI